MKKTIYLCAAAAVAAGLLLLGGCVESIPVSGTDAGITAPAAVSGTEPLVSPADTAQQIQSESLSAINTRKLMQVNFEKVYRVSTESAVEYYGDIEGSQKSFTHSELIPEALLKEIAGKMENGTAQSFLEANETGTEISEEQFFEKTGADSSAYEMTRIAPYVTDIDNDGTDDVVAFVDLGGTGGFSDIEIYKGGENGYNKTDSLSTIRYPLCFVSYEGKNYMCHEVYDYNTKYFSGYELYCISDGRFSDMVNVLREISDYNVSIPFEDSGFSGIDQIRGTLVNKNIPKILDANSGVIYGTAEEVIEKYTTFSSDIDNDGDTEAYTKYMWLPSNMGTVKNCIWNWLDDSGEIIEPETDPIKDIIEADTDIADIPYTFWLDQVDGKNVLYLYTDGEDRFVLSAYVVEK